MNERPTFWTRAYLGANKAIWLLILEDGTKPTAVQLAVRTFVERLAEQTTVDYAYDVGGYAEDVPFAALGLLALVWSAESEDTP
jgi:hypothetical protein